MMSGQCRYAVLVDGEEKKAGSILEDFEPSVNPPEEIDDPEDSKPEDWVDTPKYAAHAAVARFHGSQAAITIPACQQLGG